MSIKEKVDKFTAEYEKSLAESNRLWDVFKAEESRIHAPRDAWLASHNKTSKLGHHLNALKEIANEDHTAEQIEQDWSE